MIASFEKSILNVGVEALFWDGNSIAGSVSLKMESQELGKTAERFYTCEVGKAIVLAVKPPRT